MPDRTAGEYLSRWGFTVQRPARPEANQKPEQVEAWLNEEYPAIHRKARAENAEIFWGDETAVQNVANYARGYAAKGQTPVRGEASGEEDAHQHDQRYQQPGRIALPPVF